MLVFILILLVLAAAFGILNAVLEAVAFLVITVLLTVTLLGALAWWGVKRQARKLQQEYARQIAEQRSRSDRAGRAGTESEELPPPHDDRY